MPFTAIAGTFRLVSKSASGKPTGFQPDGDSLQFKPQKPKLLDKLQKLMNPYRLTSIGSTQLRFEGIDALELHFAAGKAGIVRQPLALAREARDRLVTLAALDPVDYAPPDRIRVVPPVLHDGAQGWILSRSLEVYGRPVAFAFVGDCPHADGASVHATEAMVAESLNARMLEAGEAYPLFYDSLFADLRAELAKASQRAKLAGRGLWPSDQSATGCRVSGVASLEDHGVLFPKLFRRLAEYYGTGGKALSKFPAWLAARQERVLDLDTTNSTHFDTYVEVSGSTVKLAKDPARLVFTSATRKSAWM
jgi:endonuclease YncB( thermonuclease family)